MGATYLGRFLPPVCSSGLVWFLIFNIRRSLFKYTNTITVYFMETIRIHVNQNDVSALLLYFLTWRGVLASHLAGLYKSANCLVLCRILIFIETAFEFVKVSFIKYLIIYVWDWISLIVSDKHLENGWF